MYVCLHMYMCTVVSYVVMCMWSCVRGHVYVVTYVCMHIAVSYIAHGRVLWNARESERERERKKEREKKREGKREREREREKRRKRERE